MSTSLSGASGSVNAGAPVRTSAQIEADLNQTRTRLVDTVGQLEDRLSPRNIVDRQVSNAKAKAKAFYLNDQGNVRPERVAMTAGAVVAGVVGIRLTSKFVRWMFAMPTPMLPPDNVVYVPVSRDQLAAVSTPLAITAG